jgi:hypothetical protein
VEYNILHLIIYEVDGQNVLDKIIGTDGKKSTILENYSIISIIAGTLTIMPILGFLL